MGCRGIKWPSVAQKLFDLFFLQATSVLHDAPPDGDGPKKIQNVIDRLCSRPHRNKISQINGCDLLLKRFNYANCVPGQFFGHSKVVRVWRSFFDGTSLNQNNRFLCRWSSSSSHTPLKVQSQW